MEDILTLVMIQTDLPSNQIGKVYSLRMILSNAGISLGLLLAVPLFSISSVQVGIGLCALLMVMCGLAGLIYFGLRERNTQAIETSAQEQSGAGM